MNSKFDIRQDMDRLILCIDVSSDFSGVLCPSGHEVYRGPGREHTGVNT